MKITEAQLRKLAPYAKDWIVRGLVDYQQMIYDFKINTPLRLCHFLAQLAHESAGFRTTEEYASGAAYEGRRDLGNTQKGDGVRFKGRGLIQCTGRANTEAFNVWTHTLYPDAPNFLNNPEELEKFPWALLVSVWYWQRHKLNDYADEDDVLAITRKINGGTNGLADRKNYLAVARGIWENFQLKRGDTGPVVKKAQEALEAAGYSLGKWGADGAYGRMTQLAVKEYQLDHGLKVTGEIDQVTATKLEIV